MDAGVAFAVMGNHELNAIHFHTQDPETGKYLRARSDKNIQQHQSFLDEFPTDDPNTESALAWMKSLPLFLELDGFRAVHACWSDQKIEALKQCTDHGVLSDEQFVLAGREGNELFGLVDTRRRGQKLNCRMGTRFTTRTELCARRCVLNGGMRMQRAGVMSRFLCQTRPCCRTELFPKAHHWSFMPRKPHRSFSGITGLIAMSLFKRQMLFAWIIQRALQGRSRLTPSKMATLPSDSPA